MGGVVDLWERPMSGANMIAGWRQWADAGGVSSALPQYLINETGGRKIGELRSAGFYLFQIPGTHHLLRPVIVLDEGHSEELQERRNEFFSAGDDHSEFLVFLGDEPHRNEEKYVEAFLDAVESLGVRRVAVVAGVHGPMPYDLDREISCVYSLPTMKHDLSRYAVELSNYEGGATIGVLLADRAEKRGVEVVVFYAMVPSYEFSGASVLTQRMAVEVDFRAWYELMRRLKHMFRLTMDLSDLRSRSEDLTAEWDSQIDELATKMPQLGVRDYLEKVNEDFTERSFLPLSGVWEEELGDLFEGS
jgi:proteasome assembly chaperone (PAC2) family protein